MPAKRFDFTPIPQPAAPARDEALAASPDGSRPLAAARLVPLDRLVPDPDQPRKVFGEEALAELADSLRAQGMRQPITAYFDDSRDRFVVISGERRLLAARRAGLAQAPVLVERRPTSEGDKLVLQLAENLVREDLTVPEAARALARLKELRPKDWLDVAQRHGIGRRRAYQYLEHLKDAPPLREALEQGTIAEGHAEELRRVPSERLTPLLDEVMAHDLSVADTRRLIAVDRQARESGRQPGGESAAPARTDGATAGAVADLIAAPDAGEEQPPSEHAPEATAPGAAVVVAREQRRRSRDLRARLDRIARELRNMHVEEVSADLPALPGIIAQARQIRADLDAFIVLLERVQLDQAGSVEEPPR